MSLQRFLDAQGAGVYERALAELRAGRKRTHWMWFVLPQLRGLGTSEMAQRYGIADAREVVDYLRHPVLGARLAVCVSALVEHADAGPVAVLGEVDASKLRSCLTLFDAIVHPREAPVFDEALRALYGGIRCGRTLRLLGYA